MSSAIVQLLVLAGIAVFLIVRLRSVLGTREGFEKPSVPKESSGKKTDGSRRGFEVIEGGIDADITDHVPDGSDSAKALASMKLTEPGFNVGEFLHGARGAYEMILMAFEAGHIDDIKQFLSDDVYESFKSGIKARTDKGLTIEANFIGVRDLALQSARFSRDTNRAELTIKFVGELTSVVHDEAGKIVEGSATEIKRQRDIWTFAREMGSSDPNWILVATAE